MGRPGFKRILRGVAESFQTRRAEIDTSAQALEEAVAKAEIFKTARGTFDAGVVDSVIESALSMFDEKHGGFGQSPKFPHASAVDLLLERYQSTGAKSLLHVAERTLTGMAEGGVYDQLAGGFHRYSVDERWCVPHFEKMTYDNSELLKNFLHGMQVTQSPELYSLYSETASGIIDWVTTTLSDQTNGGFYASQDADQTLDDDGDYFTWTLEEVRAALTPEEVAVIGRFYDVQAHGEMHHNPAKNVLWRAESIEQVAKSLGRDSESVYDALGRSENKMLVARNKRKAPFVDTTMYVAWNSMFVSAYFEASRVLSDNWMGPDCRAFALKTLDRILAEAWDNEKGFLHRVGGPRLDGSLDDQIFTVAALLDAYEITLDRRYFEIAERALRLAVERYGDPDGGGFFDRAKDAAPMGGMDIRRKPLQDSPTPGANSVAVIVLDRMYGLTGDKLYHDGAEKTLEAFVGLVPQYGLFAATYGLAALLHARHSLQVVVLGAAGDPQAAALEKAANEIYRFGKSVLRVTPETLAGGAALVPALRETLPHLDAAKAQALVCVETTCHPPVADVEKLKALLTEAGAEAASK